MIDTTVGDGRNGGNGSNGHPIFSLSQRHSLALRIADVDGVTYEQAHQHIRELLDADLRGLPAEPDWRSAVACVAGTATPSDLVRAKLKRHR